MRKILKAFREFFSLRVAIPNVIRIQAECKCYTRIIVV